MRDDEMKWLGDHASSLDDLHSKHGMTVSDAQGVVDWHRAQRPKSADHISAKIPGWDDESIIPQF